MKTIQMIVKDGHLVSVEPTDLPEGMLKSFRLADEAPATFGMTEEEQGGSPEAIERWCREILAIPPLEMSPEDEAAMWAWREKPDACNLGIARREFLG